MNFAQLALRKFHFFTGLLCIGLSRFAEMMSEGLCWDLGKGSRIMRSGRCPSILVKARSGFVVVFHQPK